MVSGSHISNKSIVRQNILQRIHYKCQRCRQNGSGCISKERASIKTSHWTRGFNRLDRIDSLHMHILITRRHKHQSHSWRKQHDSWLSSSFDLQQELFHVKMDLKKSKSFLQCIWLPALLRAIFYCPLFSAIQLRINARMKSSTNVLPFSILFPLQCSTALSSHIHLKQYKLLLARTRKKKASLRNHSFHAQKCS